MIVAAIDPGLNGACAILSEHGVLDAFDMPTMGEKSKRAVNGAGLARRLLEPHVTHVVIEAAQAYPKQGVSSVFRYGAAYGQCVGVAHGLFLPVEFVAPATWKKAMRLDASKENSRRRAIEAFPDYEHLFALKRDHNKAEASLLAQWFLRSGEGASC